MAPALDVLVLESSPAAADEAAADLDRAGHRLHRCYDAGERGFPCKGVLAPSTCPIEQGVDVAVLVRPRVAPRPTPLETGVSCAVRAGIPLIEVGGEALDPFGPWVTARLGQGGIGVADACTSVAERTLDPLLARVRRHVAQTMATLAPSRGPVTCVLRRSGPGLHIELSGPRLGKDVQHALALRVADAVRSERRSHTTLDISYRPTGSPPSTGQT